MAKGGPLGLGQLQGATQAAGELGFSPKRLLYSVARTNVRVFHPLGSAEECSAPRVPPPPECNQVVPSRCRWAHSIQFPGAYSDAPFLSDAPAEGDPAGPDVPREARPGTPQDALAWCGADLHVTGGAARLPGGRLTGPVQLRALQKELNKEIHSAAEARHLQPFLHSALVPLARDGWDAWDAVNVATALYRSVSAPNGSLHWQRLSPTVMGQLAEALDRVAAGGPGPRGTARAVAIALYGLHGQASSPASRSILRALAALARSSRERISAQLMAKALYGLQRQQGAPEANEMLEGLTDFIRRAEGPLDAQGVGTALYGLHAAPNSAAARGVLAAVAGPVARCAQLDGQAVGNALYGLQRMEWSPEAEAVVQALAEQVRGCQGPLGEQELANALYGLQWAERSAAARKVLGALVPQVARGAEPLSEHCVGSALYGLRLHDPSPELDLLHRALAARLRLSPPSPLTPQGVAAALFGLQRQGEDEGGARGVLAALCESVRDCEGALTPRQLAMALYGLGCAGGSPEADAVLGALAPSIAGCHMPFNGAEVAAAVGGLRRAGGWTAASRAALAALAEQVGRAPGAMGPQEVAVALHGVHRLMDCPEVDALLDALAPRIAQTADPLSPRAVGVALYGLHWRECSAAGRRVLGALHARIADCPEPLTAEDVGRALVGLRRLHRTPEVDAAVELVAEKMLQCEGAIGEQEVVGSAIAQRSSAAVRPARGDWQSSAVLRL